MSRVSNMWVEMARLGLCIAVVYLIAVPSKAAPLFRALQSNNKQGLFEGDIVLDKNTASLILYTIGDNVIAQSTNKSKRVAIRDPIHHWKHGTVPFVFDNTVDYHVRSAVASAFHEFHLVSCVHFLPRTTETDFVHIVYTDGCNSPIGRQGGRQELTLGPGCRDKVIIMHELMHTLGFFHEQSRFDRDLYVSVLWWNIVYGAEKNFATYSHGDVDTMDLPYDLHSITHYDNKAFTKNGDDTIEAVDNPSMPLGNTKGLSKQDIIKVNKLYQCYKRKKEVKKEKEKEKETET